MSEYIDKIYFNTILTWSDASCPLQLQECGHFNEGLATWGCYNLAQLNSDKSKCIVHTRIKDYFTRFILNINFVEGRQKSKCSVSWLEKTEVSGGENIQISWREHMAQISQSVQDLKSMSHIRNFQDVSVTRMVFCVEVSLLPEVPKAHRSPKQSFISVDPN